MYLDIRTVHAKSQLREHQTGFDHSFEPPRRHQPNPTTTVLHDRMPVILEQGDWPAWLGEVEHDSRTLPRPSVVDVLRVRCANLGKLSGLPCGLGGPVQ
jgi:hypothetical protein